MSILISCYIIPILLSLFFIKKQEKNNILSKDATLSVRGIGMLLIVFAHAIEGTVNTYTFFIYVSAILGVSACFLVSGYGLYFSFEKKENYLKGFLFQKFFRLLIPYLIFFVISIIYKLITKQVVDISNIVYELLTLQLDGLLLWYLKIQLLFYVFFYISFKFIKNKNISIVLLIVLTVIYYILAWQFNLKSYWYNTCLFFPIGILLARFKEYILPLIRKWYIIVLSGLVFLSTFIIIYLFGRMNLDFIIDGIYMISFNTFIIGLYMSISNSHFLKIFGKYSMEIYLSHLLLLNWDLFGIFDSNNGYTYLLLLIATLLFSVPVFIISNKISLLISRRNQYAK